MALTDKHHHSDFLTQVVKQIEEKLPPEQAKLIAEFARQYYDTVAVEDLQERDMIDVYGAILSHWEIIRQRLPGECNMRIYNPHYEQHGWQSTHTIIEIAHDDMPFLVDSLCMELDRQGITTHLVIHFGGLKLRRDDEGIVTEVLPFDTPLDDGVHAEAPLYIEIDRQTDSSVLAKLDEDLHNVLEDVHNAVYDWRDMRGKVREVISEIEHTKLQLDPEEIAETRDLLRWVENDHFTFLGYRAYEIVGKGEEKALRLVANSGLGVLRDSSSSKVLRSFAALSPEAREIALSPHILIVAKTNTRSTIHRPAITDMIIVKRFNDQGEIIGEHWFIGLYTSAAYSSNPRYIPFLRRKVAMIVKISHLSPTGHAGKSLLHILETLPRDFLFLASVDELSKLAVDILHLQERKRIRLFAIKDLYSRFIFCLVYIPRHQFNTDLGNAMQEILKKAFKGLEISYTTWFSDSVLARLFFTIRIDQKESYEYDLKEIEKKLIEVARSWKDELRENLLDYFGEEKGNALIQKYLTAFPAGYRETFAARTTIYDIEHIEMLTENRPMTMSFFRPREEAPGSLRFKLFRPQDAIPLSDALPIFENMGLRVIGERPYAIEPTNMSKVWINDFSMVYPKDIAFDVEDIKEIFQEGFLQIWRGYAENDGFNSLLLRSRLSWREISVIRCYTKYLRQTGFTYSQSYIEECFAKSPTIAGMFIKLFKQRFDPELSGKIEERIELSARIEEKIQKELDNVSSLDEERILKRYLDVLKATLRTNYFQKDASGRPKSYLSIKLDPTFVPELPLPLPRYEIFVYSPRLEGVHLRSSKVARGGLRWSDRREDFRTEVLGLMKAQNVKNAVIVPSGAKGGFVPKCLPIEGSREDIMAEVITCYKTFILGLLDITDNLVSGAMMPPADVVRYDDDDPYMVVAADKGTATFSDIANGIAEEYGFWLGDAFASGGCTGYDHKKMGITARGAWESVKRHFRELGHDIQNEDFTVVGIGDMSGDVFGNGMLLSRHTKLVGAFNHQHIFLDPNPDPEISYQERERLFGLPRSTWEDYDHNLISKGGGVYRRTAKAIKLSSEAKELLGIKKDFIIPNELVHALLTAKVDLLWNGGIGTFVKSHQERDADVGDRANDNLRINGSELNCRVVGEGGNLGLTQLGRIEYELHGGRIFTDFIDNSAGVDCSDHEVNIKILLNTVVANGDLTEKHRNALLAKMTDEVAELVLRNNYRQTQAISFAAFNAVANIDLHSRYIQALVQDDKLNRELEFLPDDQEIIERKSAGKALTGPELAILFTYAKSIINNEILESDLPEDPYLSKHLELTFPEPLRKRFRKQMDSHKLRREIIATSLSNAVVNEMGFTFVYQLQIETGASAADIIRAYTTSRMIFRFIETWQKIEQLDYKVPAEIQLQMISILIRYIRRATRWFLRNRRKPLDISVTCQHFAPRVVALISQLPELLVGSVKEKFEESQQQLIESGVPEELAIRVASARGMISALDIIETTDIYKVNQKDAANAYFNIGEALELSWVREQVYAHVVESPWDVLAKEACRDDLDLQQRNLAIVVLQAGAELPTIEAKIENWKNEHADVFQRWHGVLAQLRSSPSPTLIMFTVAIRELMDLTQAFFQGVNTMKTVNASPSTPSVEKKSSKKATKKTKGTKETTAIK